MKKISIIYHSGVGNTKLVARIMKKILEKEQINVYLKSVEAPIDKEEITESSALIFGFPTYHASPSTSMKLFIENNDWLSTIHKPYFVYTTYGLYSGDALRIFAKLLDEKAETREKLFPVYEGGYRMAATDGVLLAPRLSFFQTFEKNLVENIKQDLSNFKAILASEHVEAHVKFPKARRSAIFNYPNKKAGEWFKFKIKVDHETCITCNKCVMVCPHDCLSMSEDSKIIFEAPNCENCYRCVHDCPVQSLSITKRPPKKQLKQRDFNQFLKNMEV